MGLIQSLGISKIYSYKRRTRELRAKAGLPQLFDEDDLPDPVYDPNYVHVLTDEEQKDLHRRTYRSVPSVLNCSMRCYLLEQVKFHHSQTWYKPHGTGTHRVGTYLSTKLWTRIQTRRFLGFSDWLCVIDMLSERW